MVKVWECGSTILNNNVKIHPASLISTSAHRHINTFLSSLLQQLNNIGIILQVVHLVQDPGITRGYMTGEWTDGI
jgi:hypothetical protein